MINNIEFTANNLTANAGVLPLLKYTEGENIFQEINENLIFENNSTEKIKMNHLKTLICGGFIGIDKLERFYLLKSDPLIKECGINVRNPENISRFLSKFDFKTTQMLRDVNFKVFKKLLKNKKMRQIVIDIDSTVINTEGTQEGAVKGYNPKHKGNNCFNILMAFCDELKAYITGFMRSGDTYTSNGTTEMIKEIIANLKDDVDNIIFRMDSGYFSEEIVKIIEESGYQYVIKAKKYSNFINKIYASPKVLWEDCKDNKQSTCVIIKPDKWDKARSFVVVRELKPKEERKQISLFESDAYKHTIYVVNVTWGLSDIVKFYEKRGNCENYIKETKYNMNIGSLTMMLVYNIFLLFKMDKTSINEYSQWILTFRLKYIFVAGKIIKTARQTILKISKGYPYKKVFL